jgi:hypothetical protein
MEKIPCFVLVYAQFEVMAKSVASLIRVPEISISVVENPSPVTLRKSLPYFLNLLQERKIQQYCVFQENIRFNALETVIHDTDVSTATHIVTTDGDIELSSNPVLEQIKILKNPEVVCCSVQIDLQNYPTEGKNSADRWFPPVLEERPDYIAYEGYGHHFNMFRKKEFDEFFSYLNKNQKSFVDEELSEYIRNQSDSRWAVTKNHLGDHLSPFRLDDPNHPYVWHRQNKNPNTLWKHAEYIGYIKYYIEDNRVVCTLHGRLK